MRTDIPVTYVIGTFNKIITYMWARGGLWYAARKPGADSGHRPRVQLIVMGRARYVYLTSCFLTISKEM